MSTKIFLTTGTSWTVPSDWNNSNNSIEVIGAGGNGGSNGGTSGGGGGGAGGYAKYPNLNLTAGSSITYQVGTPGNPGSDTYFNGASLVAASIGCAAAGTSTGITGGTGSTGVSTSGLATLFKGGNGGTITAQHGGAGGGGAAGPNGAGVAGAGDSGSNTGATGGNADAGSGGAGGATGVAGGNGTEFDGTHGAGGGGGGGSQGSPGAASGGNYGGGGGGGQISASGNNGIQGLIVITYTSIFTSPRYWVGGTGNWDASTTTHWSSTSGGSGGSSVPTSSNDVVFDFNSGTGTTTVTASTNSNTMNIVSWTGTLNCGNNFIGLAGSGNVWNVTTGFTLIPSTSVIRLTDATSNAKIFNGQGLTYYGMYITGTGTGTYTINGSNTFLNSFVIDTPPHTVLFQEGTLQTLAGFGATGTAGNLLTFKSTVNGLPWFMHLNPAGTVNCDYISLQDSHVS